MSLLLSSVTQRQFSTRTIVLASYYGIKSFKNWNYVEISGLETGSLGGCYLTREVRLTLGYRSRNHYSSRGGQAKKRVGKKTSAKDITRGSVPAKQEETALFLFHCIVPWKISLRRVLYLVNEIDSI